MAKINCSFCGRDKSSVGPIVACGGCISPNGGDIAPASRQQTLVSTMQVNKLRTVEAVAWNWTHPWGFLVEAAGSKGGNCYDFHCDADNLRRGVL